MAFELPKGGDFTRAFEAARECFQNEWRGLEEGRSALFQQCEAPQLQIREERQYMQAHCSAANGENNGPRQRICQLEGQIQHMLEGIKSPQETYGALAAESGHLKAGGSKRP
ncbi:hypothetical protein ERJ75_000236700 [Trypanosoma vivax]|uniref:Uncharacterized protein n=1 Tax=Trypanosoma vivax (strain Y486) TaxID=1055687 RepID=F9WV25_TRYVY|nr:hypothetical protein TRVL_08198 [Trypanosoma vivax]KAH8618644.1 hypothetical protein ERJ75_000236800 [Trypanosoma vivax]KAH8618684.1 hypothetical protein ERJ75_000236700 [Trypanosoma vivax]CCD21426.1 hypothetical protein, conserved in T. vivax [Trypanosoma vivax Y486]|eukprot:CCD21426.1 hypothetical protein, conserved in T. vivax [Trypanosoma vivax Y486]